MDIFSSAFCSHLMNPVNLAIVVQIISLRKYRNFNLE